MITINCLRTGKPLATYLKHDFEGARGLFVEYIQQLATQDGWQPESVARLSCTNNPFMCDLRNGRQHLAG